VEGNGSGLACRPLQDPARLDGLRTGESFAERYATGRRPDAWNVPSGRRRACDWTTKRGGRAR
jgi:hypothetical protein